MLPIYDAGLNAPRLWYILVNVCTATTEYYARVVLSKRMLLSLWMLLTHSVSNARALRRSVPFRTAHIRHPPLWKYTSPECKAKPCSKEPGVRMNRQRVSVDAR